MVNKMLFVKCLCLLLAVSANAAGVEKSEDRRGEPLFVMFWNLENFFDWKDGGGSGSDREFSSFGERHWTKSRFYTKCNVIAKTFLWMEDEYGRIQIWTFFLPPVSGHHKTIQRTGRRNSDRGG